MYNNCKRRAVDVEGSSATPMPELIRSSIEPMFFFNFRKFEIFDVFGRSQQTIAYTVVRKWLWEIVIDEIYLLNKEKLCKPFNFKQYA